MATLNLSEPGNITAVYSSIIENKNNWLLLHYVDDSVNELGLHSFGDEGLEELKNKIDDLNKIFIAFYREECDLEPGYIIINYIPPSISKVRRARALVHSRRVGTIFKKHETIFTVDNLSLLTSDSIHHAITNSDAYHFPVPPVSTRSSLDTTPEVIQQDSRDLPSIPDCFDDPPSPIEPIRPPSPFADNPMVGRTAPPRPNTPSGPKAFLSNLLKKKRKTKSVEDPFGGLPPPPIPPKFPPAPPKDKATFDAHSIAMVHTQSQYPPEHSRISQELGILRHRQSRSVSDFRLTSLSGDEGDDDIQPESLDYPSQLYTLPLKGKWDPDAAIPSDPAERARRRHELKLRREQEEREAREEEKRRQQSIKMEKEALLRQEAEEEKRRKEVVETEIRRIREERRRREVLEREEEEAKRRELEETKRRNRDRRMEEHRKLERWREEQARKAAAAARQAEEAKRREEVERKRKIQEAATKLKGAKDEAELTGWFTMLSEDSISWKRRYYKFVGTTLYLYRDKKDLTTPLEQIDLKDNIKALKEWNEGYEDLEAITFSFVVEFKRDHQYWSMYADSEEEKFKLLGLFKVAGGL